MSGRGHKPSGSIETPEYIAAYLNAATDEWPSVGFVANRAGSKKLARMRSALPNSTTAARHDLPPELGLSAK